jgi:hypothetical protein
MELALYGKEFTPGSLYEVAKALPVGLFQCPFSYLLARYSAYREDRGHEQEIYGVRKKQQHRNEQQCPVKHRRSIEVHAPGRRTPMPAHIRH